MSLEFELVRETAKTNWREPHLPWGGIADITEGDVQQAYSALTHPLGAYLLKAKYAMSDHAAQMAAEYVRNYSIKRWAKDKQLAKRQVSLHTVEKVGELALLYYLFPRARTRSVENNIAFAATSKQAWRDYLRDHHTRVWNHLENIGAQSEREVKRYLYRETA